MSKLPSCLYLFVGEVCVCAVCACVCVCVGVLEDIYPIPFYFESNSLLFETDDKSETDENKNCLPVKYQFLQSPPPVYYHSFTLEIF